MKTPWQLSLFYEDHFPIPLSPDPVSRLFLHADLSHHAAEGFRFGTRPR